MNETGKLAQAAPVASQGEIYKEISNLQKSVTAMRGLIGQLEDRLSSILGPSVVEPDRPKREANNSDLGGELAILESRLQECSDILTQIKERVEL